MEAAHGGNPCKFVRKYRETKRERFLTDEEFRRLGEVLDGMEAEGRLPVHPAAAIRLLMLTGCRRNEIVELQWKDVDLGAGELRLRDSKSGARLVPLSPRGGAGAGGVAARGWQSLGHSGKEAGAASDGPEPLLGACVGAGGASRGAAP